MEQLTNYLTGWIEAVASLFRKPKQFELFYEDIPFEISMLTYESEQEIFKGMCKGNKVTVEFKEHSILFTSFNTSSILMAVMIYGWFLKTDHYLLINRTYGANFDIPNIN